MKRKNMYFVAIALLCGLTTASCGALIAGGAAAGATYAYTEGWSKRNYEANLQNTYDAALSAVQSLEMNVTKKRMASTSAEITANSDNTKYWINLDALSPYMTRVSIRAGVLGNEAASKRVHQKIDQALQS